MQPIHSLSKHLMLLIYFLPGRWVQGVSIYPLFVQICGPMCKLDRIACVYMLDSVTIK